MNINFSLLLTITIPALVTILGFIINYIVTTKTIASEIHKQKSAIYLEKMVEIPAMINSICLNLMDAFSGRSYERDELTSLLDNVLNTTLAYGTKSAVTLALYAKDNYIKCASGNFSRGKEISKEEKRYIFIVIQCFSILFCQVKFYITNIKINSKELIDSRIQTNQVEDINLIIEINNYIVKKLKLDNFLIIK